MAVFGLPSPFSPEQTDGVDGDGARDGGSAGGRGPASRPQPAHLRRNRPPASHSRAALAYRDLGARLIRQRRIVLQVSLRDHAGPVRAARSARRSSRSTARGCACATLCSSRSRNRAWGPTSWPSSTKRNASGVTTIAITNDEASPLAREADLCLPLCAGPEVSVAATKTFIASAAAGAAIIAACAGDAGFSRARGCIAGIVVARVADQVARGRGGDCRCLLALCPRPRPVAADGHGGGAEAQGDERHPCRSLLRGRGAARPDGVGR